MIAFETLAGGATGGTLYGIGVGPGDVRYLTLRAAGLVRAVDVVAFFAKRGAPGNARRVVAPNRARTIDSYFQMQIIVAQQHR